ncbi:ATP F0F1 synthase subunit B [Phenylobacterium sp.]|jgi:F-type H+-transporting ATPase subunit b|uniref:F0F1 ATP synthase subunit B family protein n=1 Tax=Phenylobacterium sp. TaxID=1871053 RepID=UPI0037839069
MPAFFHGEFWSLANPELWVGAGMVIFLAILWFAGGFKMAASGLDAKAEKIRADLDEAARIRAEAEALLADINRQHAEAEAQARSMIEAAEAHAKRLAEDTKTKLEEDLALRTRLAERKIEAAQAEAAAQVKAAAIDLAARAAEQVLASRVAGAGSDPLIDRGIGQLAAKMQ